MTQVVSRTRARDAQWALVFCESCPRPFTVKARAARAIRAGTRTALCESCVLERRQENLRRAREARAGQQAELPEPDADGKRPLRVTSEMRVFWWFQFSDAEIVEMAEDMWGPRSKWDESWRDGYHFDP